MTTAFLTNWLYVAAFLAAGAVLVILILAIEFLVNPRHPTPGKLSTYECGIVPVGDSWHPFAVRYYVFGLLFLVFEVEAVFLFPWALELRSLGAAGFIEVAIFIGVLGVGLLYAWRKGALDWH
ncbi:MAG: NADH-quinone oxidoreductase subunit A [Actinobacteria bacterium]|nr:NADH-quinone oxidoreductase subunit A [Actinomycetota bacterium]